MCVYQCMGVCVCVCVSHCVAYICVSLQSVIAASHDDSVKDKPRPLSSISRQQRSKTHITRTASGEWHKHTQSFTRLPKQRVFPELKPKHLHLLYRRRGFWRSRLVPQYIWPRCRLWERGEDAACWDGPSVLRWSQSISVSLVWPVFRCTASEHPPCLQAFLTCIGV